MSSSLQTIKTELASLQTSLNKIITDVNSLPTPTPVPTPTPPPPTPTPPKPTPTPTPTTSIINGIYVLDSVVASAIASAPVGVKVVEATSDGAGKFWSSSTVTTMKSGGGIVLGYLDCGFCESYRPYYSTAVSAGIIINPSKPVYGSGQSAEYSVEFWSPTWLTICQNWISNLITSGFDGVYLDVIDAWCYSAKSSDPVVVAAGGLTNSANYMTRFISNLRNYAHGINPNFLVWTNGGEELFEPSLAGYNFTVTIPYISVIDGMYKEQVCYNSYNHPANTANRNAEYSMLANCTKAIKPVVLIEYVDGGTNSTTTSEIADVKAWCSSHGFGYYIAKSNQNLSGVDTIGWTA